MTSLADFISFFDFSFPYPLSNRLRDCGCFGRSWLRQTKAGYSTCYNSHGQIFVYGEERTASIPRAVGYTRQGLLAMHE